VGLWRPVEDFDCAICQRQICMRWNFTGPTMTIPPICRLCEDWYTRGVGKPTAGSFRDRREVMRGFAIAEALHSAAGSKRWSETYGTARL
jgi:hypothetical protein